MSDASISFKQAEEIKAAIHAKGKATRWPNPAILYLYAALKDRFGIVKYTDLPAAHYEAALTFIHNEVILFGAESAREWCAQHCAKE